MLTAKLPLALTFDDVLLLPAASEVLPHEVDVTGELAPGLRLPCPLLSSAMDTVTEARLAIALGQLGGLGVLHKNMSAEAQAAMVAQVKATSALAGAAVDGQGRLLAAAAVGVGPAQLERAAALVEAGLDLLVVDSAHGHSRGVLEMTRAVKLRWPGLCLVAGNVATAEGAQALVDAGADVVKVGIGPGSICTTRVVAGVGVPQLTAVAEAARVVSAAGRRLIADGGIQSSGDVAKAFGAGADAVMIGSLFAATTEAPGAELEEGGRRMKAYRGMGSLEAMAAGSSDRYFQERSKKLVPEGVVARVPHKGDLADVVHQLVGGLRAAMGYTGNATIGEMKARSRFVRMTGAGLRESHVHHVAQTHESPNYPRG